MFFIFAFKSQRFHFQSKKFIGIMDYLAKFPKKQHFIVFCVDKKI